MADRVENRIDTEACSGCVESLDRLLEGIKVIGIVRNSNDFCPQTCSPLHVARVTAQHQFRPGGDRRFDLAAVEAVDRYPYAFVAKKPCDIARLPPGLAGHAAEINQIGAVVLQGSCLKDNSC